MGPFLIKVKVRKDPRDLTKVKPLIEFMKPEFPYAVLSVFNQSKKIEDGSSIIITKFLIGDSETGELRWVDSHGVDFFGVV